MKKKILAFLSSSIFIFVFLVPIQSVEASYAPITPLYQYVPIVTNTIYFSGTTMTYSIQFIGDPSITQIMAYQYLQKLNNQNNWETVSGWIWSQTSNGSNFTMSHTIPLPPPGTYRLRTILYVYRGNSYEIFEQTDTFTI